MAQRATQAARSAAQLAGARLVPAATTSWRRFLERNKQYVQQEEPRVLAKQLLFTSLTRAEERLPVHLAQLRAEAAEARAAAHNWRELPLRDVGIAALFAAECFAWFCVGEIAGRGWHLTGYEY